MWFQLGEREGESMADDNYTWGIALEQLLSHSISAGVITAPDLVLMERGPHA